MPHLWLRSIPAQWLNRVLEKVWPYYDEAVCKMVKARVLGWSAFVFVPECGSGWLLLRPASDLASAPSSVHRERTRSRSPARCAIRLMTRRRFHAWRCRSKWSR